MYYLQYQFLNNALPWGFITLTFVLYYLFELPTFYKYLFCLFFYFLIFLILIFLNYYVCYFVIFVCGSLANFDKDAQQQECMSSCIEKQTIACQLNGPTVQCFCAFGYKGTTCSEIDDSIVCFSIFFLHSLFLFIFIAYTFFLLFYYVIFFIIDHMM